MVNGIVHKIKQKNNKKEWYTECITLFFLENN